MGEKPHIFLTQEKIKNGTSIPLLEASDIEYLTKPIGKALYKNAYEHNHTGGEPKKLGGRPRKTEEEKKHAYDRVTCEICGGNFIRNHRSEHNKTKVHQAYEKINRKLSKVILNI